MTTTDILLRSATDLVHLLRDGVISSRELLERSLARVEETNLALNAVVTLAPDRARSEADLADKARADGRQLPAQGRRAHDRAWRTRPQPRSDHPIDDCVG